MGDARRERGSDERGASHHRCVVIDCACEAEFQDRYQKTLQYVTTSLVEYSKLAALRPSCDCGLLSVVGTAKEQKEAVLVAPSAVLAQHTEKLGRLPACIGTMEGTKSLVNALKFAQNMLASAQVQQRTLVFICSSLSPGATEVLTKATASMPIAKLEVLVCKDESAGFDIFNFASQRREVELLYFRCTLQTCSKRVPVRGWTHVLSTRRP